MNERMTEIQGCIVAADIRTGAIGEGLDMMVQGNKDC
jgi:hypothetical protein